MIEVIAEHSVDISLLPDKALILDAGCRGMLFANEMRRRGHVVVPLDCDDLSPFTQYNRYALSDHDGRVGIRRTNDPQATTICDGDEVPCISLNSLADVYHLDIFDLIKLDIEGSEYEVIMSMNRSYAKQLSIEFHLHTGVYGDNEMLLMENKLLSLGYFPIKHDRTSQHGMGLNYWDSLWILQ